jgi:hypothetical protein
MIEHYAEILGQFVEEKFVALRRELAELRRELAELRRENAELKEWKFLGVWTAGAYCKNNHVTYDGSEWIALADTSARPGTAPRDWQLCVKRGRDAPSLRPPSAHRPNGGTTIERRT